MQTKAEIREKKRLKEKRRMASLAGQIKRGKPRVSQRHVKVVAR